MVFRALPRPPSTPTAKRTQTAPLPLHLPSLSSKPGLQRHFPTGTNHSPSALQCIWGGLSTSTRACSTHVPFTSTNVGQDGGGCFYRTATTSSIAVLPFGKSTSRTTTAALLSPYKFHSHRNWLKQDLVLGQRHCSAGGSIRTPQRADPSRAHLLTTAQHPA